LLDIILKIFTHLIKEIKQKFFLSDINIIDSLKTLLHTLDLLISEDHLKYTTRVILINLLSELCKKFFFYSEILSQMKIKIKEGETEIEEILIFSMLLNIFKTDQLILEYENKKSIRRAIIICLSFEEVAESSYIENDSLICEILIEKLCNYYSMLPEYFELSDELVNYTIEVAPNMKRTFPVLVNTYLEFRDYVFFFNKLCNTIRSNKLKEKLKIILFNKFLLGCVQDKLISSDLRIIRSNLQYFIFILKTLKNNDIVNLFFNFIFGFNEKNSRNGHMNKALEKILYENTLIGVMNQVLEDKQTKNIQNINKSNQYDSNFYISNQTEENYFDSYKIEELDYDYQKHENISIGLSILNNLHSNKEKINIVIITLFEAFFEKCPYMTIHKVILPFTETCLKQMENTEYLLQNEKTYPNVDCFFSLLSKINDYKKFQFSEISSNLDNNLYRSYSHYINNDIDFYYYYLNQREDQENFQFFDENVEIENREMQGDLFKSPDRLERSGEDLPSPSQEDNPITTNFLQNEMNSEPRTSLVKQPTKFNFDYFTQSTKQKINLKNKLFDDLNEIEEEFNNIHVSFMKGVLEKFVNFMNNTHIENLFFTVKNKYYKTNFYIFLKCIIFLNFIFRILLLQSLQYPV
jgi:hypothetical protein